MEGTIAVILYCLRAALKPDLEELCVNAPYKAANLVAINSLNSMMIR